MVAAMVVVLACAVALLSARLLHQRRLLVAAKVETRRMLDIVKQRVERPNVFSHEVRTPLALIQGAAELLADEAPGPLNDRQREFVTTIITTMCTAPMAAAAAMITAMAASMSISIRPRGRCATRRPFVGASSG